MPDVDGFDEFYRGSRQRLLGFVYVLTGDLAEAQDAVQEAYVRAWQRWSTVSAYEEPEAWVRVVDTRLREAQQDPRAAAARRQAGLERAAAFSWSRYTADVVALYTQLAAGSAVA